MVKFYIARVLAYLVARVAVLVVWSIKPKAFTPWIQFNGKWVTAVLEWLMATVSEPWSSLIREFLWLASRAEKFIVWFVHLRVKPAMRDHVEVLLQAFLTPGGLLMLGQLAFVIFVMIRVWQFFRKRRRARRVERAAHKKQVPVVEQVLPRLPPAPQLNIPPRQQ